MSSSRPDSSTDALPSSPQKRLPWADLAGLMVIVALAAGGYFFGDRLLSKTDRTVTPPADCHINLETCTAQLSAAASVELTVAPRPVPLQKPFNLDVRIAGLAPSRVDVEFSGVEMNMGLNRVTLGAAGDGRFAGEATIPVCVTGPMNWRASVIIETAGERIAVPYIFQTGL